MADIDAIYVSNFFGGPLDGQLHLNSAITSLIPDMNIPIVRVETACASSSVAFNQAIQSLNQFSNVMIIGVENMPDSTYLDPTDAIAMAADNAIDYQNGLIFPASYALITQQYMLKYGIGYNVLEKVSYRNH